MLPFANLSGDPAQDYLADALTDELTTALARIRDSFVIARNTAFTYKGKPVDAKAIGKDLGVRYVLEGSVQPSGNQVRVNAQLIDADSGAHLWAEQFDTPRADLLQMQDEIVTHLARAMDIQLTEAEAARLKRTPAANPDAEDLALQCDGGRTERPDLSARKRMRVTVSASRRSLADPNNVRALSLLSLKFWFPVAFGRSADPEGRPQAGGRIGVAKRSPSTQTTPRLTTLRPKYSPSRGASTKRSRRTNARSPWTRPRSTPMETWAGITMYLGQFEKSLEFSDKAIRLSPHDPSLDFWYRMKATAYFGLKQYDQAIEWARRAIAINPNNPLAHFNLIAALALTGREAEAHEALAALPCAGSQRTQDDRGVEGGRRSRGEGRQPAALSRNPGPDIRGPAQGGSAGGMKQV